MTPAERAEACERALRPALRVLADPASDPAAVTCARGVLERITELIDGLQASAAAARRESASPLDAPARARMRETPVDEDREAGGLRQLRKGRDQCTAHRRDGEECQAPAVAGTLVCRRHGGAAPQVLIKARHVELQMALHDAHMNWREAKGTPAAFDALCACSRAENALNEYEAKLAQLSELRAELRRRKAESPPDDQA